MVRKDQTRNLEIPGSRLREPRNDGKPSPHSQEIPLADLNTVVAQDAVGGGGVEVEIRKRIVEQVLLAFHRHRVALTDGEGYLPRLAAIELRRLERLYIVDGFRNPLLQFLKALLGV